MHSPCKRKVLGLSPSSGTILGESMTLDKSSIYDNLRIQIVKLHKENNALRSDIEILKVALADEVAEKYKAYQKLSKLT